MLTDHLCMDAHCAIIMFDVTSRVTFQNVAKWYREIVRVCGEIPIVLCGNKVDAADSRARVKQLNFHRSIRLPYFEISAASQYHQWDRHYEPFDHLLSDPLAPPDEYLEDPLEWLTRKLFGLVSSASTSLGLDSVLRLQILFRLDV
jgi:GTPase SAR1 family protein